MNICTLYLSLTSYPDRKHIVWPSATSLEYFCAEAEKRIKNQYHGLLTEETDFFPEKINLFPKSKTPEANNLFLITIGKNLCFS